MDNGDEKDNNLKEKKISQPNNAFTTHCSSGTYNIFICFAFSFLLIQTLGFIYHKSGVILYLTEKLKQVATLKNEQKRLYDIGVKDIKHLEIKEKVR